MEHIELIRRLVAIAQKTSVDSIAADAISLEQMSGGDINDAAVVFVGGETYFAKWNDRGLARQFEAEADGLERIRNAAPSLGVPMVHAFIDDDTGGGLLMQNFEGGRPISDFDAHLGRGLAELHRTTDARGFGLELDGYCGATFFENTWSPSWVEFYRERRLVPLVEHARARGMSAADVGALEALLPRLGDLLGEGPSSLIHGDLWSGNQIIAPDGQPAILDPAAFFGHRELELGMMLLFGGFSDRVFDVYEEAFPLDSGWRDRTDLFQLFHILNHYHLFGGAYGMQAARIARRFS